MNQERKNEKDLYNLTSEKFTQSSSNSSLEGNAVASINETDGKVKTKLMSIWNNVKYGWTVKIKTNFSKDSPVWLLGKCYHFRNAGQLPQEEGIEGFKSDFGSRIWLTYRKEFPLLNGSNFTSDCGWGCMIRSGQMLLAQALICHYLGRDWRWSECINLETHRNILKWFGDTPCSFSPFSIHTLVQLGETSGKKPGDWYGPASVAHLLKQAVQNATQDVNEFDNITVYIAQDCTVYIQDLLDLCIDSKGAWKSVMILIPARLGAEKFNPIYARCLTSMLTLNQSIGIIGGRPKHSLYFVGFQENNLIHLDPHYCQNMVDVCQSSFPVNSFHCNTPRKMNVNKMDPSCCFGFYCKTKKDFEEFHINVQSYLIPSYTQKCEYPMFVFCESRSIDVQAPLRRPPKLPIDSHFNFQESDEELESEEFEFV